MSFSPRSWSVSCLPGGGALVMSGVAIRASNLEFHVAVVDLDLERVHRLVGRERAWAAAAQVEERAVAGTLHCTGGPGGLTLGERPVVVGAAVLDRDQRAVATVENADLPPVVGLDQTHLPLGKLVQPAHGDDLARHARHYSYFRSRILARGLDADG